MVRIIPQGLIFAADRNITETEIFSENGNTTIKMFIGQSKSSKVFKWPNNKAVIGYAGLGSIGNIGMEEWIFDFIGKNLDFKDFSFLANKLKDEVEDTLAPDFDRFGPEALVIHLGGFEERNGCKMPTVWFIRNSNSLVKGMYKDIRKNFFCGDAFWELFPGFDSSSGNPALIKHIEYSTSQFVPVGFQQGIDLEVFNAVEGSIRLSYPKIEKTYPEFYIPQSVGDWEKYMKWTILTYGAFYEVFNSPGRQYVGGGVDSVFLPWNKE
jgi:hypothetical protein